MWESGRRLRDLPSRLASAERLTDAAVSDASLAALSGAVYHLQFGTSVLYPWRAAPASRAALRAERVDPDRAWADYQRVGRRWVRAVAAVIGGGESARASGVSWMRIADELGPLVDWLYMRVVRSPANAGDEDYQRRWRQLTAAGGARAVLALVAEDVNDAQSSLEYGLDEHDSARERALFVAETVFGAVVMEPADIVAYTSDDLLRGLNPSNDDSFIRRLLKVANNLCKMGDGTFGSNRLSDMVFYYEKPVRTERQALRGMIGVVEGALDIFCAPGYGVRVLRHWTAANGHPPVQSVPSAVGFWYSQGWRFIVDGANAAWEQANRTYGRETLQQWMTAVLNERERMAMLRNMAPHDVQQYNALMRAIRGPALIYDMVYPD